MVVCQIPNVKLLFLTLVLEEFGSRKLLLSLTYDTNVPSYINKTPKNVLRMAEKEKKQKYSQACEEQHANFTPLCISIYGLLGKEKDSFIKRLAQGLAIKWDCHLSTTLYWTIRFLWSVL